MSDLFGHEDALDTARRAPAVGPPTDFSESLQSAFAVAQETETSAMPYFRLRDEYEGYLETVESLTGERFGNPMDMLHPLGDLAGLSMHVRARAEAEGQLQDDLAKLREQFVDLPVETPESLRGKVAERRRQARLERAEVAARETGFGSDVAVFLGTAGGIMTDPFLLGTMGFGAPLATSFLRLAAIEAGIGGAAETMLQLNIQATRSDFGEQMDLEQGALSVATVTAGAGILAPVIRGAVVGVRGLLRQVEKLPVKNSMVRAAERFLRRKVELEEASPLEPTPAGRAEHVERIDEAMMAAHEGRAVRMTGRPRAPVREDLAPPTAPREVFGDDALGRDAVAAAEAGARGRAAIQATTGEDLISPAGTAPPPSPSPPPKRAPGLGKRELAEERDLGFDTPEGRAEDAALEVEIREMAKADPEARIVVEDGETVRALTARQLIDELDEDRKFLAAVRECVGAP